MEAPPVPMNRKTRYYYNHKDDPDFQARAKEAKRRYYVKNREEIIAKTLERYYALKAVNQTSPATDPAV